MSKAASKTPENRVRRSRLFIDGMQDTCLAVTGPGLRPSWSPASEEAWGRRQRRGSGRSVGGNRRGFRKKPWSFPTDPLPRRSGRRIPAKANSIPPASRPRSRRYARRRRRAPPCTPGPARIWCQFLSLRRRGLMLWSCAGQMGPKGVPCIKLCGGWKWSQLEIPEKPFVDVADLLAQEERLPAGEEGQVVRGRAGEPDLQRIGFLGMGRL